MNKQELDGLFGEWFADQKDGMEAAITDAGMRKAMKTFAHHAFLAGMMKAHEMMSRIFSPNP